MAQSGLPTMEQALEKPSQQDKYNGAKLPLPDGRWDFSGAVAAGVIICVGVVVFHRTYLWHLRNVNYLTTVG